MNKIPALLSVYDALRMSPELRHSLIQALSYPDQYMPEVHQVETEESQIDEFAQCLACISFSEEDAIPEDRLHNRPLYMKGSVGDICITRIFIDCGSAVNLLPLRVLTQLGYSISQLSPSHLKIQGFNQSGQRSLGVIHLKVELGEFVTIVRFHVIDSRTSYNMLLGRPWLHENAVIPSSLYQCLNLSIARMGS